MCCINSWNCKRNSGTVAAQASAKTVTASANAVKAESSGKQKVSIPQPMKVDEDDSDDDDDEEDDDDEDESDEVHTLLTILCLRMYLLWWSPIASRYCLNIGFVQVSSVHFFAIWRFTS